MKLIYEEIHEEERKEPTVPPVSSFNGISEPLFLLDLKKLQSRMRIVVLLTLILPIILVFFLTFIDSADCFLDDFLILRFGVFLGLIFFSFLGIVFFSRTQISKPVDDKRIRTDKNGTVKAVQWSWIVFRLSHHHPQRRDHELKIGENWYLCSGCFGTVLGLTIGGLFCLIYLLDFSFQAVWLGIILIALGIVLNAFAFSKYLFSFYDTTRFLSNSSLPLGTLLTTIGVDIIFNNILSVIYILVVVPVVIYNRFVVAKIDHRINDISLKLEKFRTD